ncbi:efflux RND transporter periplasmic adaptor subunit [Stenotrophomonas oahuensis]|uniref:Efflux RND transporter periplasmic adaptor subunit n=1 Tax=Stenotrophomonas oahuensis TaxID=3003271 RepID=A0ABY9YMS1_9GAMM|nr:efflux RND transporter periplasmic adaptor subunit [Stenotrophomonas sp. A5586]WNH52027.1 efflux RND transporter periplasmic adaptor subunit [Stenotrophomonas sp. A5586]
MKHRLTALTAALLLVVAALALGWHQSRSSAPPSGAAVPVLSVTLVQPRHERLPVRVPATGNIAAWQEASVGAETDGQRLTEVLVNVGDVVQQGQLLARFSPTSLQASLAEAEAAVTLARAEADEAASNHQRAQGLDAAGVMSKQQVGQYSAVALTSRARLQAAQAVAELARLRVQQTRVLAPSDGTISARTATVGAVVPAGQELFRLIKDHRLEWRAVVSTTGLAQVQAGQPVRIATPAQPDVVGRVRMVGPMIDTATRSGLVFVDLPTTTVLRAGAFAQGQIEVGDHAGLTLPNNAVLARDGLDYVMEVGQGGAVHTRRVTLGQRVGERVEISAGLDAGTRVIGSGLGLLNDGDTVRVVNGTAGGMR